MNTHGEHFELPENNERFYQAVDQTLVDAFPKIYIFSVDPIPHIVSKGGRGEFVVPAKPDGERVSAPLVIPGRHAEHMQMGGQLDPLYYEDGMRFAKDIVGTDSSDKGLQRFTSNLEWHGVFITLNEKPTEKEVKAAEAKRVQYLERLVADADQKFVAGKQELIDGMERKAAHELHLKKTWAEKPTAMDSCPACGGSIMPNRAVCMHCNAVLDEQAARKFFPERFAVEEKKPEPVVAKRN